MNSDGDRTGLTCKHFVAELNDYLDDAMDAVMRATFDQHVLVCRRCRILSETTRKTVALYKGLLPHQVPLALESRVMAAIRSRGRPRP